jgi:hypothetical protein
VQPARGSIPDPHAARLGPDSAIVACTELEPALGSADCHDPPGSSKGRPREVLSVRMASMHVDGSMLRPLRTKNLSHVCLTLPFTCSTREWTITPSARGTHKRAPVPSGATAC